ncbi:MAG: pentapeptide repeat-containing protein [Spirulina sp.]
MIRVKDIPLGSTHLMSFSFDSHNAYPDCVRLDLQGVSSQSDRVDLWLSLHFSQQWQSILEGRLCFAIGAGELKLELGEPTKLLPGSELSGDLLGTAGLTVEAIAPVSPHHPRWRFRSKPGEFALKGSLEGIKLGTVAIADSTLQLGAMLTTTLANVRIVEGEGLWPRDISPNKHAILDRTFAHFLWQEKLVPYLSAIGFSATRKFEANHSMERKSDRLQETVKQIVCATTDNVLELAKIAELDPMTEFAGGNFLATNLNAIDLGGADLTRINLRGATLNDTDFNEANLQEAKLSGADLTGAFLENAQLKNANLYRASLALVNLAGVDLRGADLQEANLSETTWTGTRVEGAKFSSQCELPEDIKQHLQEQGAIFV